MGGLIDLGWNSGRPAGARVRSSGFVDLAGHRLSIFERDDESRASGVVRSRARLGHYYEHVGVASAARV